MIGRPGWLHRVPRGFHVLPVRAARGGPARVGGGTGPPDRPLLLRGRKVVAELSCDSVLPSGLGDGAPKPGIGELEPDDVVLLYTDGVTEARTAGGSCSGWTGWPICWSGKPPAAGRPRYCCGAWCGPCSTIRLAACAMTPRCCWCRGRAPDQPPAALTGVPRGPAAPPASARPPSGERLPAVLAASRERSQQYPEAARPRGEYSRWSG